MFRKVAILCLCLLLASCASSGELDNNVVVNDQISHADAYTNGMRYLLGRGVPKNYTTARNYFEKAADSGNPYAENELGFLYLAGKGVPQNYVVAFKWYQKAAKHGLASAQYNLGLMYLHGVGTPVNKAAAQQYFQQAAQRGFKPARSALAST